MKKLYCEKCNDMHEYHVRKNLIKTYKGSEVNVVENIAICDACGEELFEEELERDNLKRLYAKYAEMNNLITADEIVEFRKKHSLSQRELTSILDLGKMTINRYENGSLPTKSNSEFLKIVFSNEEAFMTQFKNAYKNERISSKTYQKINDELEQTAGSDMLKKYLKLTLTQEPSEYNGFKKFDFDKTESLIAYLADKVDLTVTSVNKYLWYIDFTYFKEHMTSITGLPYVKNQNGPVVYKGAYDELLKVNPFVSTYEEEQGEYQKKRIIANKEPNMSLFSEREKAVIDIVVKNYKSMYVCHISGEPYKEQECLINDEHQKISYNLERISDEETSRQSKH